MRYVVNAGRAVSAQVLDFMFDQLLLGRWTPGNKMPSIRVLATVLNVNPATVASAYRQWQEMAILRRRRGLGYWVMPDGLERARRLLTAEFTKKMLPIFLGTFSSLGYPGRNWSSPIKNMSAACVPMQ